MLDMTVKTIRYVLDYSYDRPHGATWALVEGDVRSINGEYRFEETDGGTTATCSQAIDLGFWLPGFVRSGLEKKALRDSVEEFRQAVEARARGGACSRIRSRPPDAPSLYRHAVALPCARPDEPPRALLRPGAGRPGGRRHPSRAARRLTGAAHRTLSRRRPASRSLAHLVGADAQQAQRPPRSGDRRGPRAVPAARRRLPL